MLGLLEDRADALHTLMSLAQVNLPANGDYYTITVQAAGDKFLQQLLCINRNSNPQLGSQYPGE